MIVPVILSGGAGTRLWPMSRELYPKQLLPLAGDKTMLQETISRLDGLRQIDQPLIVCNEAHRFMVAEQVRLLDKSPHAIILEPCGRNSAPAVAMAALHMLAQEDDPVLLILPADHLIQNVDEFQRVISSAVVCAEEGALVTFGIVPTHAETGYGYIEAESNSTDQAADVINFIEKPDLVTAQRYVASENYYWNSGMFMFRASRYLEELKRYRLDIYAACTKAYSGISRDLDFMRLEQRSFADCPSDSIDYAVMEKTDQAVVFPLDAGWNDIGTWSALWTVQPHDEQGNVKIGDVLTDQVTNSYIHAQNRLVAAVGVDDLVIVETADAVLISQRDKAQNVKLLLNS